MKKKVFALWTGLVLFLGLVQVAGAVSLSPPKILLPPTNPGQKVEKEVMLINNGQAPVTFYLYKSNLGAGDETGRAFAIKEPLPPEASVANWIKPEVESVTIGPNEKETVKFSLEIPENAEPGGHYGSLDFSTRPPDRTEASTDAVLRLLILVTINGEIYKEGELVSFDVYNKDDVLKAGSANFDPEGGSWFFEYLPVGFVTRIKSTGNVHIKPRGKIEIFNTFGGKEGNLLLMPKYNEEGVKVGEEFVDELPVNSLGGNVLPDQTRAFPVFFENGFLSEKQGKEGWEFEMDFSKPIRIGKYTAKMTLYLPDGEGGEREVVKEIGFWILPWKQLLLVLVALVIIVLGWTKYRGWSKKRMKEKLMRELGEEKKGKEGEEKKVAKKSSGKAVKKKPAKRVKKVDKKKGKE